ncbi:MAG: hypothetical protein ACI8RD_012834, partial [Bacillariaceae sp.]
MKDNDYLFVYGILDGVVFFNSITVM